MTAEFPLIDKTALVTGSNGHIAPCLIDTLIDLGATVTCTDHKAINSKKYLDYRTCDLTSHYDIQDLCKGITPDIMVHCAALTGTGAGIREGWAVKPEDQTLEAFKRSVEVQAYSLFLLQKNLPSLTNIVVLGSIYGQVAPNMNLYEGEGYSSPLGYTFTKWGLRGLVKHLAVILAPKCRVNTLVPGGIERGQSKEFVKRYIKLTPMGRMCREEDLQGPLEFLVTDMSSYVTGTELVIDGGWTVW